MSNDVIITCEFSLSIIDKSFTGKKPPEEIVVIAKLRELNCSNTKKIKNYKNKNS